MWELRAANPALSRLELYPAGAAHRPRPRGLGGEHAGDGLRRRGAAAAAVLVDRRSRAGQHPDREVIAQEIVRTLVGAIGLVAAVPITTALAAAVAMQELASDAAAEDRLLRGGRHEPLRP